MASDGDFNRRDGYNSDMWGPTHVFSALDGWNSHEILSGPLSGPR
jgi:hypothetical protein